MIAKICYLRWRVWEWGTVVCSVLNYVLNYVRDGYPRPEFGRRSFFSAKPTFFPRSGFFFGRRGMWVGCEATHREQRMGIQWRKLVFGFIPICRLTKGLQPSHPRHPTFCSFPSFQSIIPPKPHQIKQPLSKIAVNERAVLLHNINSWNILRMLRNCFIFAFCKPFV